MNVSRSFLLLRVIKLVFSRPMSYPNMSCPRKVIVVGAGAAGLAAASRLFENGIQEVLVLEAEDRIGGRIYTLDVDEGNVIELGAQWVHGEKGNVVFELANARNLLGINGFIFRNMMFVRSDRNIIETNVIAEMTTIFEKIRDAVDDDVKDFITSGAYFQQKIDDKLIENGVDVNPKLKDQFVEWFHQFINSIDGSDSWFESAASTLLEYWECEGHPNVMWKENGYRTILSILMEKAQELSNGKFTTQNILTNREVIKILMEGDKVIVKCADGKTYFADHVIVTVSLGVLKDRYTQLFEEGILPKKKILAIEHLDIGSVNKMFLRFPYQWWSDDVNGISLLWNKEDRDEYKKKGLEWLTDVFAFCTVDNNPLVLCGWISGPSSRIMEQIDEENVANQLTDLLKHFVGHLYKIPEPDWFFRSTWKANKNFKGCYSFRTPTCDALNISSADLAPPIFNENGVPLILFAGEATHPHFYSTVHGAVETGWREADRLISLEKSSK